MLLKSIKGSQQTFSQRHINMIVNECAHRQPPGRLETTWGLRFDAAARVGRGPRPSVELLRGNAMAIQPTPSGPAGSAPSALEQELAKLRQLSHDDHNRRDSQRWPVELPLDGWLELDDDASAPIPVVLMDLSSGGVAVVLRSGSPVRTGQRGRLITQAHGGGCGARPVRCCWLRLQDDLLTVGLAFEPDAAT